MEIAPKPEALSFVCFRRYSIRGPATFQSKSPITTAAIRLARVLVLENCLGHGPRTESGPSLVVIEHTAHTVASRKLLMQLAQELRHLEEEEPASGHSPGQQAMTRGQEPLPIHVMSVAVRGANGQVAYTRLVRMREVTFTCAMCGQTVTQLHHPSGRIKYCSEACRTISAAQRHEARVARQREKRRITRGAQLQAQQEEDL